MPRYAKITRERLLWNLISKIRSNLDICKIKKLAANGLSRVFDPYRCTIIEFDNNQNVLPIEPCCEYLSSKKQKSMVGVNLYYDYGFDYITESLIKSYKEKKQNIFYIKDFAKYLKENNLFGSKIEKYFLDFKFKSCIGVSVFENDKIKMFFIVKFNTEKIFSDDDIEFLKVYAEQIYIAINQSKIVAKFRDDAKKDAILQKILNITIKSLDVDKITGTFISEMSKKLKVYRAAFCRFDPINNTFLVPDTQNEYLSNPDVPSFRQLGRDFSGEYSYFVKKIINTKDIVVIKSREDYIKRHNLEKSTDAEALRRNSVYASILVPILYKSKLFGLYIFSYDQPNIFTQEDIDFTETISKQTALAIYQAEILTKLKKQVKNEAILRKIITTAAETLSMSDIQKIVKDIGKITKADRCYFVEFDIENFTGFPVDDKGEYRSSDSIKSILGYTFPVKDVRKFVELFLSKKDLIVFDYEKIMEENLPEYKGIISYAKDSNLKSGVGVPFFYMGKFFALLCIEYCQEKIMPNQDEFGFLRLLSRQLGFAFKQIKLYQETKLTAERESLIRNVISMIASSLNLSEIKKYITQVVGNEFKLDRCFIVEYNSDLGTFENIEEDSEYRSSPDIKTIVGYNFSKRGVDTYLEHRENFLNRAAFVNSFKPQEQTEIAEYLKEFSVQEGFYVCLTYGNNLLGFLVGHFCKKGNRLKEQDCSLIRIIAKQIGIAIYQSSLYYKEKQTAEREKLLRDIITTSRSTINIEQIKATIVKEILKTLSADMVSIFEYYQDIQKWENVEDYSEALSSPDKFSFKGLDVNTAPFKFFSDTYIQKKELVYDDLDKFIEQSGLVGTPEEELLHKMKAESAICIPILYRDEVIGVLTNIFEKKHQIQKSQVDFIRSLAEQIGIAIYQTRLFEKEKNARKKESTLNNIVSTIRKSLELNEMKKNIATEIGKHIDAERVIVHLMDPVSRRYHVVDESSEYYVLPEGLSYVGIDVEHRKFAWSKELLHTGDEIFMPNFYEDVQKYVRMSPTVKKWVFKLGISSEYIFPIKYQDVQLGNLYIIQESRVKIFSAEELSDIRYLIVQIGFALNQAITYRDLQSKIKQELLLRKVTETIRGSLDITEIKQRIVDEIGKTLGADRCYLRSFNVEEELFLSPDAEYLSSPDIPSLKNIEPDQEGLRFFFEQVRKQDGIYPVEVTKDFIIEHNVESKSLDRYFKQVNIKSDFAMPVWSKKGELTFLVLHYVKESFHMNEEVKQLLILLSRQISLALEQSDLYSDLRAQTEREISSRKVVEVIRSSLDLDKILETVAHELMVLFNVQRVFVGKINFTDREKFVEVTDNPSIGAFSQLKDERFNIVGGYWQEYVKNHNKIKALNDVFCSDLPEEVKKAYESIGVKSIIGMPIQTQEGVWGGIFLSTTTYYKKWTSEEMSFLDGIVSQLDTAIRQAELYAFQKRAAYKESVLRNLISEIKLTRDLNQAYSKLLELLARVFGLDRVLFLEPSAIMPEELHVKYEYVEDREDLVVNNAVFPSVCLDRFFELVHRLKPLIIDNVELCNPKNVLSFFEQYKIKAMMAVPLVKYNKEVNILGFIALCSEEKREWTAEEIDLINVICDSVVSVIWEISKFIEIEDLRNSFVLTLAHDFQVPLIGEKLAIEFLLEKSIQGGGHDKELLQEILENNSNIIALLNKSVDIYNYDAGKKTLLLDVYEVSDVINNALLLINASSKKDVKIDFFPVSEKMLINVDRQEMLKVLHTILDNAIEHTPQDESVKLKCYSKDNRVVISVHNGGAAIPRETQDIIFKRYEMALAIERKIGAGTGLFLAKKIVEAHKGHIWFETSNEFGTVFYVSLPYVKQK